jgi:N-acetylglucosamine malate deacetylase 1
MGNGLTVMAIGAHPDDIEIACAGTLARCAQRGDRIVIATLCGGEMASSDLPVEKLVEVRRTEAEESAKRIGAECVQLGMSDGCVEINQKCKDLVTDAIRRFAPDVVITHFHNDYGGDHNNTFTLVLDATLYATIPHVRTKHPPIKRVPYLFMMEPLAGYGFQPEVYVDITDAMSSKTGMLECHCSQFEWMKRYGGMDFRKYIDVVARFRGYQCGVEFAEGFIPHKSWAHIPASQVLP